MKRYVVYIIIFFALLATGYGFINFNQNSKKSFIEYNLSNKCSEEAKSFFGSRWVNDDPQVAYINHYNKVLNKCYIKMTNNTSQHTIIELYDVLDSKKIADLYTQHPIDNKNDVIVACYVNNIKCFSAQEFDNLVQPLLGQ